MYVYTHLCMYIGQTLDLLRRVRNPPPQLKKHRVFDESILSHVVFPIRTCLVLGTCVVLWNGNKARSYPIQSFLINGVSILSHLVFLRECAINPLHVISAYGHCKATLGLLSALIHGQDQIIFDSEFNGATRAS
jgi:hypothetical protein